MKTESLSRDRELWCRDAIRVATRLNVHHGLSSLVPKLSVALIVLGVLNLALREVGVEGQIVLLIGAVCLLGVSLWSIGDARHRFRTGEQALITGLVRLETILQLNNGLSASHSGGLPWPKYTFKEPAEQALAESGGYQLNWKEFLLKPCAALIFFLMAGIVPVHPVHPFNGVLATQLPPDLVQVQTWLDKLKQENLIEPEKLKEAEDQLDQFKNRSPQEWYTQENLEAADALKESTAQSLVALENGLDKADQALQDGLDKTSPTGGMDGLNKDQKHALQDEMKKAGEALSSGTLPAKQEVVKQLTGAEDADEASMTHDQMQKLQKRIADAKKAAAGAGKNHGEPGDGKSDADSKLSKEMQDAMKEGEHPREKGSGRGPGHDGDSDQGHGTGGVGGGTQSAPLELEQREQFADGTQQKIKSNDPFNAMPGELVNVSAEAPKVDPTQSSPNGTGGSAQIQGNGREAVWRSDYDPDEAAVLRTYFK